MEFRILGPLDIRDGGHPLAIGSTKQRALLAQLLLRAPAVVPVERLIDGLWGESPPATARVALQNNVSQLRKLLGAGRIATSDAGYALVAGPAEIDLGRFDRLLREARAAPTAGRAVALRAALALWRGPPLADLADEPFAGAEIAWLRELQLTAREDLVDAELELGRHADVLTELEALVRAHPYHERLRGQLMLALYRAGRQADALAAYHDARRTLLEELGLEPSPSLRELERAILRHDPRLWPASGGRSEGRRTVTVLAAEVAVLPAGAEPLDLEARRDASVHALGEVRAAVEEQAGALVARAGDELVAVFGVPAPQVDDPLRAVRAAVQAQAALAAPDGRARCELRIGIATGVALAGLQREDAFVSGDVVTAARRLAQAAAPAGTLLDEATVRAVGPAATTLPAKPVALHGGASLPAHTLVAAADLPPAPLAGGPLIGREEELEQLRQALARARATQRAQLVTLVGEPGVGKSRLLAALAGAVAGEALVLTTRCSASRDLAYGPVAALLDAWAGGRVRAAVERLLTGDDDAAFVAARVEELVERSDVDAPSTELRLAFTRLVEALALDRPVLLVLDELERAGPELLDLVEHVGRAARGAVVVACAARPELLETRPGWARDTVLELRPLPRDRAVALLAALAPELPSRALDAIAARADGNPLFLEQLLVHRRERPDDAEDAPAALEALLAARLARLDRDERLVLERAAVVGRDFWRGAVLDLAADEVADVAARLASLTRKGFVEHGRGGLRAGDALRFHHPLIRDVLYAATPKTVRADVHERLADWLELRAATSDELIGLHLEAAFRHRVDAGRADGRARRLADAAGNRLAAAGMRAFRRGEAATAVDLLRRALALLPLDAAGRNELACELGVALRTRGDGDAAVAVLTDAAASAEATADRRVALRARLELANVRLFASGEGTGDDVLAAAAAALPVLEAVGDDRGLGRAFLLSSFVHGGLRCRAREWQAAAERALVHYRRAGWPVSTCLGEIAAALYFGPTPVPAALAACDRLLLDSDSDRAGAANVAVFRGGLEAMRGRFDEARRLVAGARAAYEELGQFGVAEVNCGALEAEIELLADDAGAAERAGRATCAALVRLGDRAHLATQAAALAEALYAQGRYADAEAFAAEARASAPAGDLGAQFTWRAVTAKLHARAGAVPEAVELAGQALRLAQRTDVLDARARVLVDAAEVWRLAGRFSEAEAGLQQALRLQVRKGNEVAAAATRSLLAEPALT